MLKKIAILLLLVGLAGYFVVAVTILNKPRTNVVCSEVDVFVGDSAKALFLGEEEVMELLNRADCHPIGERMEDISLEKIEKTLSGHAYVNHVVAYKTPGGKVHIILQQRMPVLNVMTADGQAYFLDNNGNMMPKMTYTLDLPVATGKITPQFAHQHLLPLARWIQNDPFWNSQVMQIDVSDKGEIELVPRVGEHTILLGAPVELKEKLNRMKAFYTKGLNKVGWNKYATISLKYENQIVCKKK